MAPRASIGARCREIVMRSLRPCLIAIAFAASSACFGAPPHSAPRSLAIVGATVIDPSRDGAAATLADATVVVTGDRIVAVGPSAKVRVPAGAERIDGHGKWLIPGMVDGHVHFFQSGNLYTRPDVADF